MDLIKISLEKSNGFLGLPNERKATILLVPDKKEGPHDK
jgi:hypothetical protein